VEGSHSWGCPCPLDQGWAPHWGGGVEAQWGLVGLGDLKPLDSLGPRNP
jgi:hypothetical protein